MIRHVCTLALTLGLVASALSQAAPSQAQEGSLGPELSPERMLRRVTLTLLDRPPTVDEYRAFVALSGAEQESTLRDFVATTIRSDAFDRILDDWGHELLRTSTYNVANSSGYFTGTYAVDLRTCDEGTLHAGAWGLLSGYSDFNHPRICDDPSAPVADMEPWWAPGTTIRAIGTVTTEVTEVDGNDCGEVRIGGYGNQIQYDGCSCGPNLIYCGRRSGYVGDRTRGWEGGTWDATGMRRAVFEEPARLFTHIIKNERPYSDIVLGDYTVVNLPLYYLYHRQARQNSDNRALDHDEWWRAFSDTAWQEVRFSQMHPNLLDDRDYRYDPRTATEPMLGIPSAGFFSTIAANTSFPRERVRGARFLEMFACKEFAPPPPEVAFSEYQRDPAAEGTCQHCHTVIDPASIFFKRPLGGGVELGGIGDWTTANYGERSGVRARFETSFVPDTFLTPSTAAEVDRNEDSRFIDYLPEGSTLFGLSGDGTVGPLGFSKLLVESGEFDRCAVRRAFERFGGRELVLGQDDSLIQELSDSFLESDRNVLRLIETVLSRDEFRRGI